MKTEVQEGGHIKNWDESSGCLPARSSRRRYRRGRLAAEAADGKRNIAGQ
jgi:hypothetical protein